MGNLTVQMASAVWEPRRPPPLKISPKQACCSWENQGGPRGPPPPRIFSPKQACCSWENLGGARGPPPPRIISPSKLAAVGKTLGGPKGPSPPRTSPLQACCSWQKPWGAKGTLFPQGSAPSKLALVMWGRKLNPKVTVSARVQPGEAPEAGRRPDNKSRGDSQNLFCLS